MASTRGSSKRPPLSSNRTLKFTVPAARYLFFGGKGGVGKTTSAAATALYLLSKTTAAESILLISTDPAHSLSDSLAIDVGDRLVKVSSHRKAHLLAYEMDATRALERFRQNHGPVLTEIAQRGTFLDETDIEELLHLSLPGLDEVMALFELSELDRSGAYARIVVDTAPSGHTSRLLKLPDVFKRISNTLDVMAQKHRYIVAQFGRRSGGLDAVDLFIRDLNERIERVQKLLFAKDEASFLMVAIPEAMSVLETQRYAELLESEHVPLSHLIVNRVEEEHGACVYCRARVKGQKPWLRTLDDSFKGLAVRRLPLLDHPVRGLEGLQAFARLLWDGKSKSTTVRAKGKLKPVDVGTKIPSGAFSTARLLIFGGKGGVGKTTSAAAAALAIAKKNEKKKVLIFSTDPAHSLSDSFSEPIGELKDGVAGLENLAAMEIDPGKWFNDLKQRYRQWIDELFTAIQGSSKFEIKFDHEAMRELVELTPPGIDEIAALSAISDLLEKDHYDTIVLDTAPTGHLIRFLELPQSALAWVRTFIKLLLKYQHVVHATKIAEELIALSKSIKVVMALLVNKAQCEFVPVAIAEEMSLAETADLALALRRLKVQFKRVLINGVIPENAAHNCDFCLRRRAAQDLVVAQFPLRLKNRLTFYSAPQQPYEIRGPKKLIEHFDAWRAVGKARSERTLATARKLQSIGSKR